MHFGLTIYANFHEGTVILNVNIQVTYNGA